MIDFMYYVVAKGSTCFGVHKEARVEACFSDDGLDINVWSEKSTLCFSHLRSSLP